MLARLAATALAVAYALAATPLWAQADEEPSGDKSYATVYLLIVMIVGLGLMLILRPVARTTDVKPLGDDEE